MILLQVLALTVLLFIAGYVTLSVNRSPRNKKTRPTGFIEDEKPENMKMKHCILCGTHLQKGNKLVSKQLQRKDDSIIYIHGCAICAYNDIPKQCPVCKRSMNSKEYLIGRMWLREKTKKNHLHVAGCSKCAKIKI